MSWRDRPYAGEPQGPYGRGLGGGLGLGLPRLTRAVKYLLVANFAVFILAAMTGQWNSFLHRWGSMNPDAVLHGQVWRLVTYEYLHDPRSIWHILFNMLGVYFLGPPLERSWGPRKFFIFYTVGGVLGALFYMMLAATGTPDHLIDIGIAARVIAADGVTSTVYGHLDAGETFALWKLDPDALPDFEWFEIGQAAQGSMIGASGCVLAVLGACALLFPQFQLILFVFPVPIRFAAVLFCGIYVLNLISQGANAGGDAAHLAGLAYGVLWPLYGERWLRNFQAVRQYGKEQRHLRNEQDVRAELDRILRKVHEQGIHSLTAAEKRTLTEATRRQQGR